MKNFFTQIEYFASHPRVAIPLGGSTTLGSIITYLDEKVMPVISIIGVSAGTLLSLLGVFGWCRNEYRAWKQKKSSDET